MKKKMDDRILSFLKRRKGGASLQKMIKELGFSSKERLLLKKRLKVIEGRGILRRIKTRYFIPEKSNIIRGRFLSSLKGYGFVTPEGEIEEDVFIPPPYTGGAFHGDIVEVLYSRRGKKGKPEGRVLKILKKNKKRIVGLYRERSGQPFFLPLDSPQSQEIPLSSREPYSPLPGMIVEADRNSMRLTDVYGMPDEPGVDVRSVIQRYGLYSSFPKEVLEEAGKISGKIYSADLAGRKDYRRWKIVTIDGINARDFDDAVSIKTLKNGNFLLGVHIADVAHYIQPGSFLDREAFRRGTSVYFPELTLPMLPEVLSNNICSLRPEEEKLTLSVLLEFDRKGNVLRREFHPSVIRTVRRLTYDSVYKIFKGDKEERGRFSRVVPDLLMMNKLARLLRQKREAEGSLDFDLLEPELVYREGKLFSVESFEPNEAHHVIEEFMVAANEAVASYLSQCSIPAIYRIHPKPALKDLEGLRLMLSHFGIHLPRSTKVEPRDLQRAIKLAEGKAEAKFIYIQVLKSLRLAVYSDERDGHYGLAKKEYTHFTSPIRRYPDLVVHRILKKMLGGEGPEMPALSSVALHCSRRERESEAAEKDLIEWRILRFLKNSLGEEYEGIIVGLSKAGLVVELDNYFVDGIVPYADLKDDYYFKRSEKTLLGKKTGRKYELGERVKVILASVDPLLRRIDLALGR